MLVLSRRAGEKLVIGENITVEIVKIKGKRITLGISAPSDVRVLRGELTNRDEEVEYRESEWIVEDGVLLPC